MGYLQFKDGETFIWRVVLSCPTRTFQNEVSHNNISTYFGGGGTTPHSFLLSQFLNFHNIVPVTKLHCYINLFKLFAIGKAAMGGGG